MAISKLVKTVKDVKWINIYCGVLIDFVPIYLGILWLAG